MNGRRVKAFWEKRKETFTSGPDARSRAGHLRTYEHVSHVTVRKADDRYVVGYSVAGWFLRELQQAGIEL